MPCNCIYEDGSKPERCIGLCENKDVHIIDDQQRSMMLEDRIMGEFNRISNLILSDQHSVSKAVNGAYRQGIEDGIKIGREINGY